MNLLKAIFIGFGVAVLCVLLYLGAWWLREDNVNRTGQINRDSFNFQETSRDELVDQFDDIALVDVQLADPSLTAAQKAALSAQRKAMVNQLCSIASGITGDLTSIQANIIAEECP